MNIAVLLVATLFFLPLLTRVYFAGRAVSRLESLLLQMEKKAIERGHYATPEYRRINEVVTKFATILPEIFGGIIVLNFGRAEQPSETDGDDHLYRSLRSIDGALETITLVYAWACIGDFFGRPYHPKSILNGLKGSLICLVYLLATSEDLELSSRPRKVREVSSQYRWIQEDHRITC